MSQVMTKNKAALNIDWGKTILIFLPLLLVSVQWINYEQVTEELVYDVPINRQFTSFETNWLYALVLIFSFLSVFVLSFDKRVAYYKTWKYLFPAIAIVGIIFIAWDVIFTEMNVWQFNPDYYLGIKFLGLPIEELLFFVIIPFCSVVLYESANKYIKRDFLAGAENWISMLLIGGLLIGGIAFWDKIYTSTTFILTGSFLFYHVLFLPDTYRSRFYFAFIFILIPFVIVDGVLTGGYSQAPIVLYNPEEYLGLRIFSIPFEDFVYGFMMLLAIVTLMEHWRSQN